MRYDLHPAIEKEIGPDYAKSQIKNFAVNDVHVGKYSCRPVTGNAFETVFSSGDMAITPRAIFLQRCIRTLPEDGRKVLGNSNSPQKLGSCRLCPRLPPKMRRGRRTHRPCRNSRSIHSRSALILNDIVFAEYLGDVLSDGHVLRFLMTMRSICRGFVVSCRSAMNFRSSS